MDNNLNPVTNKITLYVDEDKNTNLHYAAARGDINTVIKEIDNNNEIDSINFLGWTPLMVATRHGHTKVVQYLLDKHADSTRENNFGYNILHMSIACGKLEVVCLILQHLLCGGVSKQSLQRTFSPISLAVLFNNFQIMQYLIEKDFCVNSATPDTGIAPVTFASFIRNTEITNYLKANGGKENRKPPQSEKKTRKHPQMPANSKKSKVNIPSPLILLNPNPYSPQQFYNYTPNNDMSRRCSSSLPYPCFSAGLSPFTPNGMGQVFFPPNFAPNHFLSPMNCVPMFNNLDFLNGRIMNANSMYSPVYNSAY